MVSVAMCILLMVPRPPMVPVTMATIPVVPAAMRFFSRIPWWSVVPFLRCLAIAIARVLWHRMGGHVRLDLINGV